MKNTKTEMKNTLERINSRIDEAENGISNLEDKIAENTQSEQPQEKEIQKQEDSSRGFYDNIKHTNILSMQVPEGEEREQGTENLFEEIMTENYPNLVKEIEIQAQEAQKVSNKMNAKRSTQDTSKLK